MMPRRPWPSCSPRFVTPCSPSGAAEVRGPFKRPRIADVGGVVSPAGRVGCRLADGHDGAAGVAVGSAPADPHGLSTVPHRGRSSAFRLRPGSGFRYRPWRDALRCDEPNALRAYHPHVGRDGEKHGPPSGTGGSKRVVATIPWSGVASETRRRFRVLGWLRQCVGTESPLIPDRASDGTTEAGTGGGGAVPSTGRLSY